MSGLIHGTVFAKSYTPFGLAVLWSALALLLVGVACDMPFVTTPASHVTTDGVAGTWVCDFTGKNDLDGRLLEGRHSLLLAPDGTYIEVLVLPQGSPMKSGPKSWSLLCDDRGVSTLCLESCEFFSPWKDFGKAHLAPRDLCLEVEGGALRRERPGSLLYLNGDWNCCYCREIRPTIPGS